MTLLEMLVAIAIMGVAVAGLTEVLWINGNFSLRIFNKMDNVGTANHFLELLGKDVRGATNIGNQFTSPMSDTYSSLAPPNELNNSVLILQMPYIPTTTANVLEGYPPAVAGRAFPVSAIDTVVYVADTGAGTITRYFYPDPNYLDGRSNTATVVLNNLIGPLDSSGNNARIFDYVNLDGSVVPPAVTPFAVNPTLMAPVVAIAVSLETKSATAGNASAGQFSTMGMHAEYYMRNRKNVSNNLW
jgi:prepilin-type N-terminal cleavage/methylation domain-containing protein